MFRLKKYTITVGVQHQSSDPSQMLTRWFVYSNLTNFLLFSSQHKTCAKVCGKSNRLVFVVDAAGEPAAFHLVCFTQMNCLCCLMCQEDEHTLSFLSYILIRQKCNFHYHLLSLLPFLNIHLNRIKSVVLPDTLSLSLPVRAVGKTGSNAERREVPGRREGGGPAWPNLGLDVPTSG